MIPVCISVIAGYVIGKVYSKGADMAPLLAPATQSGGSPMRFVTNGAYQRNFVEEDVLGGGYFKVTHKLEQKQYTVKKLQLQDVQLSDIFKVVNSERSPASYVTSWLEHNKLGYMVYVQYCQDVDVRSSPAC
jgi:hypothetical protein